SLYPGHVYASEGKRIFLNENMVRISVDKNSKYQHAVQHHVHHQDHVSLEMQQPHNQDQHGQQQQRPTSLSPQSTNGHRSGGINPMLLFRNPSVAANDPGFLSFIPANIHVANPSGKSNNGNNYQGFSDTSYDNINFGQTYFQADNSMTRTNIEDQTSGHNSLSSTSTNPTYQRPPNQRFNNPSSVANYRTEPISNTPDHPKDDENKTCEDYLHDCLPDCINFDSSGCLVCRCGSNTKLKQRDSNGCIACSCGTGFDPSHPEHMPNLLDSQTGSQPQQSGGSQPGGCTTDWMKCACPTYIDPSSGCIVCSCDQQTTKKGVTTPSSYMTSAQLQSTALQQTNGQTNIPIIPSVNIFPSSSLYPQMSSSALTQPTSSSSAPSFTDHSTIGPKTTVFDTKLPVLATTPQPSGGLSTSTRATTTTMAAFQCPGVFNCTKDCYTGYKMDSNGCPLCECAPMPTDLP
ncbi:hypothetical protein ACJMK2_026631, partial [Sinanodonta woodiana]